MKTLFIILFCALAFSLNAQPQFEKRYGGQGGTDAKAIRQTLDSGYIVVGGQSQPTTSMTIMKLNPMGDTIWTTDFDDPPAFGFNVEQTLDTGYIVTGYAFDPTSKAILVKLNRDGIIQWWQTYSSSVSEWGQAIKQLPDSGYIVAGARIFRTDKLGTVQWSKATGSGNQAMSMIASSDGNFVYTQTSSSLSNGTWLTKMDTGGTTIWTESFSELYTHSNCDNNVAETSDGGYIISGQPSNDNKGMLMKLDSDRNIEWTKEFQSGTLGAATSVVESDSGGFLTCGYNVDAEGIHAYLHRTDEDGNMLWEKDYDKAQAQSMVNTFDGGYAFAGYQENNSGNQKYFVVKIGGTPAVGVIDILKASFLIYPTISSGIFTVSCEDCYGHSASVIDIMGRIVAQTTLNQTVQLIQLNSGPYFIVDQTTGASHFVEIVR